MKTYGQMELLKDLLKKFYIPIKKTSAFEARIDPTNNV